MMKGIWFDNIHSYDDLNLVVSKITIPPALVKTTYVDIPGADGSVDLTEALGMVRYKDRTCSFVFSVFPQDDFEEKKREVSNLLNGKKYKIKLDKDAEYHWVGRCSVNAYASDKNLHKITVNATVEPYKLKNAETVVNVELTTDNDDCKSNAVGNPLYLDDISPVEHTLGLKVCGATRKCTNLFDESQITHATTGAGVTSEAYGVVQDGVLIAKMGYHNYGIIWKPFAMSLGAGTYTISADCYISTGGAPNLRVVARLYNVKTQTHTSDTVISLSAFDKWERISAQITVAEASEYMLCVQGVGNADLSSNMDVRFKNICVAEGDVTEYIPYFEGLKSAPATHVESVGKNLWNNSVAVFGEGALTRTDTGFRFVRGSFTKGTSVSYSIPLAKGQTVTFSCVGSSYAPHLYLYKEKAYGTNLMSTQDGKLTYTALEDLPKATFTVIINSNNGDNEISNIQVELGEAVTAYVPYTKHSLIIPTGVQALDGYGEGVNESVCNYIDLEKKQFVKSVEKIEFDGDEEWYIAGSTFWTPLNNFKKSQGTVLSSRYTCYIIDVLYVSVASTGVSTVDEFKVTLKSNPLHVVYVLDTPIITDISSMISGEGLTSFYPVTNVSVDKDAVLDVAYLNDKHTYKDIILNNGRKPVVPTIECSDDNTTIKFGDVSVTVNAGTHKVLDLQLTEGENPVSIGGFGTAKITYQEGDL